jgi:hypothetical protein
LWPDRWSRSNHNILWSRGWTDFCSGNCRPGGSSGGGWASLDTRNRRLGDHWSCGWLGCDRWGRRRRRHYNSWFLPRLRNNPPGSGRRHDRTALALHAGIRSRLARYLALHRRALARRRPEAGRWAARNWRSARARNWAVSTWWRRSRARPRRYRWLRDDRCGALDRTRHVARCDCWRRAGHNDLRRTRCIRRNRRSGA